MPQITSWSEMKAIMKKMFVAEIYGQSDLEELNSPFSSAWSRSRSARDEQKVCHGHGDQRKTQQFGYLHSQQFQDVNRQEIQQQQAVNALEQDQQRRLDRDILKPLPYHHLKETDKLMRSLVLVYSTDPKQEQKTNFS